MLSGRLRAVWIFVSGFPTPVAVLFLAGASFLAYRVWQPVAPASDLHRWAAVAMLAFGFLDWVLLAALPRLGLSFGPVGLPLFGMTIVRLLVVSILAWLLQLTQSTWGWPGPEHVSAVGSLMLWVFNSGIAACEIEGLYVEPFDVRVTRLVLHVPCSSEGRGIRIVQLSDLHIERVTKRERRILKEVEALDPDVIVLTGDYLNGSYLEDAKARQDTRWFASRLSAPLGVFAVTAKRGDTLEAVGEMFGGLDIHVLQDEISKLSLAECELWVVGVAYLGRERDSRVLAGLMRNVPEEAYSVLLYHTPELADAASGEGVDLYLTGHTHGGQMRVPLFGALFTNLRSWKKYEQGLYRVGETTIYVNRGLGMEGQGAPRARFLCRPEILVVDLRSDQSG